MGAGTSVQEAGNPADSPGRVEEASQRQANDQERQQPAEGADGKTVQKNGQISGMQGESEDQEAMDGKLEQLNGIQEEIVSREVGQGEPAAVPGGEEMEELELNQKELPVENEGGEQRTSQEGGDLPTDSGEQAEEVQAAEIGFKKVFKFVGLKFTVKKEKPVKSEPVQLLTVTREEDEVAEKASSEAKQAVEGSTEADASPINEGEGSPPEILSPEKAEECVEQEGTKAPDPEGPPTMVESAIVPAESPTVDSPLKRFFKQGFFSGLRRKPSFKKAKDEPLVIGEKAEANGEQVGVAGDASEKTDTAEGLAVQMLEENRGGEEDFEDLTAELASVVEATAVDESKTPEMKENGVPAGNLVVTDSGTDQPTSSSGKSVEGQVGSESASPEAPAGVPAKREEVAQEQSSVAASVPMADEDELMSPLRSKQQDSPLKKLFTSSSIKKLSGKKAKGKKGEARMGETDDEARLQSSTESEGSPDSHKPDSPPVFPEEGGEGTPAEETESGSVHAEQEEINGATGERKKEAITAWASFKKLVTPRKRPRESDRDDEQTDKAKSATTTSTECAASEKQEEPKSNGEEHKLERSTEDPKKKVDAPVTWEALICVGSSKKRTRKLSESELQKSNEEAQSPEANDQVQDHAEDTKVSSPQGPDQEQGAPSPECAESPVEGEASDGAISTWESFKRLVTPRRRSRSKLEERGEEAVPCPDAVLPETEPTKEESWVSLKKLIPGRRKKRLDTKPEQLQGETVGKETSWAEFAGSKSEEESDTPAVVPLSEYDSVEEEGECEKRLKVGMDEVQVVGGVQSAHEAPQMVELGAGQTSTREHGSLEAIKSSADERSPSWISAAVSDVIEEEAEDKVGVAEDAMAVKKQEVLGHEPTPVEEGCDISPDEVAEEVLEDPPRVTKALDHLAEESFTEETTEMVSAVSQLTDTPVTTAEGTPIREDEALVSRQTQEVLEEAAEKVKMTVDPIASRCRTAAGPGTQGGAPEQELEISTGKTQSEVDHETGVPELAQQAAETISEAAMVQAGPEQEMHAAMQEVAVVQANEAALILAESDAACLPAPAVVMQEMKPDAVPAGELNPLQGAEVDRMWHEINKSIGTRSVTTVTATGYRATLVEKARTEKVEIVREQIMEASQRGDVEELEAAWERSVKIAEEGDRRECWTIGVSPEHIVEKVGAEQIVESRKTKVIPARVARTGETVMEQAGDMTPEVARQAGEGRLEAAAVEDIDNAPETGVEVVLVDCTKNTSEWSAETPAKVEANVTEEVCTDETGQVALLVGVSKAETSEEPIEVTPVVRVSKVPPSEETIRIAAVMEATEIESCEEPIDNTPALGVTKAVCSEEKTELTPVSVTEVLLHEEPIEIAPAVGVTKTVCSEEITELALVGVTKALLGEESIKITPAVGVTEAVCSEGTIELAPVGVTEVLLHEDPIEITPAVGVTEMVCSQDNEITPEGAIETVCGEETTEVTPVVVTETIPGDEPAGITRVALTEHVLDVEPIEITPTMGVTEVVCGEGTTEITPAVVSEALPSAGPISMPPTVGMTEAVCPEETTQLTPLGVTKIIPVEEHIGASLMTVTEVLPEETIKVASVDLSEALPGEEIEMAPVGETEVCGGKDAAAVDSEVAVTAQAELGVEESKSEHGEGEAPQPEANERTGKDVKKAIDSERAQEHFTPVEIMQRAVEVQQDVETAKDGELDDAPKEQRTQEPPVDSLCSATHLLQSAPTEGPHKESNETASIKVGSVEVKNETVCDGLEGVQSEQPGTEENHPVAEEMSATLMPRDRYETSPGEQLEKSVAETAKIWSAPKQVETEMRRVPSEPSSTTSEGTSLEQTTDVFEPAEEVECKPASEVKDKQTPDELESIEKVPFEAGELVQDDQLLSVTDQDDQNIAKLCRNTEMETEPQTDVELSGAAEELLNKKQPLELAATETPGGFSKEKCEVDAETICPTLESAPEIKLHAASIDEFQAIQNETVTPMENLFVAKSSESCEEAFLMAAPSVEEQVIAETVTAEISEQITMDQVLPPCEDIKQISMVETAAIIVEAAIEVATGCVSGVPDVVSEMSSTLHVQKLESSRKEQLEHQLAECKIEETVTQKLECVEIQTKVEVSQTRTFEQQNTQSAQCLVQDALVLTQLQGQVGTNEEEKLPKLQKDVATEGTGEVVDRRLQTSGSQDIEGKETALMQLAEMVLETDARGGQEPIETKTPASMHTEQGRELSDNISITSEVTKAECCPSLEPEGTHPFVELAGRTQRVTMQKTAEEQTHDVKGGMISLTEELATENLEENEVETIQIDEGMDQKQSSGTDGKQSQEAETEPSALEFAKGAAENTPS